MSHAQQVGEAFLGRPAGVVLRNIRYYAFFSLTFTLAKNSFKVPHFPKVSAFAY